MCNSDATYAEYYRLGIEAGMFAIESAKEWALAIVVEREAPPGEIIEVSWSGSRDVVLQNLRSVRGERDTVLAGQWLLGCLRHGASNDVDSMYTVVRQAIQIASSAGMGDEVFYRFNVVDDMLNLAATNAYGNFEGCWNELQDALAPYRLPGDMGDVQFWT